MSRQMNQTTAGFLLSNFPCLSPCCFLLNVPKHLQLALPASPCPQRSSVARAWTEKRSLGQSVVQSLAVAVPGWALCCPSPHAAPLLDFQPSFLSFSQSSHQDFPNFQPPSKENIIVLFIYKRKSGYFHMGDQRRAACNTLVGPRASPKFYLP